MVVDLYPTVISFCCWEKKSHSQKKRRQLSLFQRKKTETVVISDEVEKTKIIVLSGRIDDN